MNDYTVFNQIVAAATINFSLAWVWLLIEGGSYSRAAFIYLPILDGGVNEDCSTEDWFTKTALRDFDIRLSKKLPRCKPRLSSAIVCPEQASMFDMQS